VVKFSTFDEVCEKYNDLIDIFAHKTFSNDNSIDFDDIKQEMLLTLHRAWKSYDTTKETSASFKTYLINCLRRTQHNIIRYNKTKKRSGFEIISLNVTIDEDDELELVDMISNETDYFEVIDFTIDLESLELTKLDSEIIKMVVDGYKFSEIAKELKVTLYQIKKALFFARSCVVA